MAGKLNTQLVRRRRQEIDKQDEDRSQGKFWGKLEEGENRVRVMPPWSEEGNWRRKFGLHYNVLENETVLCPEISFGETCPICDENRTMFKSKDVDEKAFAKKIRGKENFVCNYLNLDKNDSKVYTLEFGVSIESEITKIIDGGDSVDKDGKALLDKKGNPVEVYSYGDITDPKSGHNLKITKTVPADKMQTSYEVKCALGASEVANWSEVEKQIHNLDEYVKAKQIHSYDDLVAMMNGSYKTKDTPAPKDVVKTDKPVTSKPQTDEFGGPVKATTPAKEVDTEFTKPTGAPPVTVVEKVADAPKLPENTLPAPAMSAVERLKLMKQKKG